MRLHGILRVFPSAARIFARDWFAALERSDSALSRSLKMDSMTANRRDLFPLPRPSVSSIRSFLTGRYTEDDCLALWRLVVGAAAGIHALNRMGAATGFSCRAPSAPHRASVQHMCKQYDSMPSRVCDISRQDPSSVLDPLEPAHAP